MTTKTPSIRALDGARLAEGDDVWFIPLKGSPRTAVVKQVMGNGVVEIQIDGDPFPWSAPTSQVSTCQPSRDIVKSVQNPKVRKGKSKKMPTKTAAKPSAKELQKEARGLGIKGFEDMGLAELRDAVEKARERKNGKVASKPVKTKGKVKRPAPATVSEETEEAPAPASAPRKKAAAKKAPATKKAASKPVTKASAKQRTPGGLGATKDSVRATYPPAGVEHATEKVNPFRKGSNLFNVAPLLLKGGNRMELAKKLSEKVELHPYQKDAGDIDLLDYDKRLLLGAQTMRDKFGYGILRTGRGVDGTIKVFVPGSKDDPEAKSSANGKAGKASSKKPAKARKG